MLSLEKISRKESYKFAVNYVCILAVSFIVLYFQPLRIYEFISGHKLEGGYCPLRNQTGIPCPFCGMSRALQAVIQGDFSKAIYLNPSSLVFFALAAVILIAIFVIFISGYKIKVNNIKAVTIIMLSLTVVIWMLNLLYGHH